MTSSEQSSKISDQVTAAVGGLGVGLAGDLGRLVHDYDVDRGSVVITPLDLPRQLSFGKFGERVDFKHGLKPGRRLLAEGELGGVDALAITLRRQDGTTPTIEIGRREDYLPGQIKPRGDPESELVLLIHDGEGENAPYVYYFKPTEVNSMTIVGQPLKLGVEGPLGNMFTDAVVEKVIGFSKPAQV